MYTQYRQLFKKNKKVFAALNDRPRHSVWKNACESLYVAELHENWTRVWLRN
jgi:hypothetical protein